MALLDVFGYLRPALPRRSERPRHCSIISAISCQRTRCGRRLSAASAPVAVGATMSLLDVFGYQLPALPMQSERPYHCSICSAISCRRFRSGRSDHVISRRLRLPVASEFAFCSQLVSLSSIYLSCAVFGYQLPALPRRPERPWHCLASSAICCQRSRGGRSEHVIARSLWLSAASAPEAVRATISLLDLFGYQLPALSKRSERPCHCSMSSAASCQRTRLLFSVRFLVIHAPLVYYSLLLLLQRLSSFLSYRKFLRLW